MNQMIKAALFKTLLTVNTPIIIAENLIAAKCRLMVQNFNKCNTFIKRDL
jgi:hypothetical protein